MAGTANTTLQRAQKFCVLPPSCYQVALTNAVNGRLTTLQFCTLILAGPLASADPAEVAAYEPVQPLVASRLPPCSRRRCPREWDPQYFVDHHDVGPCVAWSPHGTYSTRETRDRAPPCPPWVRRSGPLQRCLQPGHWSHHQLHAAKPRRPSRPRYPQRCQDGARHTRRSCRPRTAQPLLCRRRDQPTTGLVPCGQQQQEQRSRSGRRPHRRTLYGRQRRALA